MVKENDPPGHLCRAEHCFEPMRLFRVGGRPIWLVPIAVQSEQLHMAECDLVIALVVGQRKIIEIRLKTRKLVPIVIAQGREEAILLGAAAEPTAIGGDEGMKVAPDVFVDGLGFAVQIIVVAGSNDEVRVQTSDQSGDFGFVRPSRIAVITDDHEALNERCATTPWRGARGVDRVRGGTWHRPRGGHWHGCRDRWNVRHPRGLIVETRPRAML